MTRLIAAFLLVSLCAYSNAQDWDWPGETWAAAEDPAALGFSPEELARLQSLLAQLNTQALHVSVAGREVFTYGDISDDGYLASVRKSILSMLYGPAVESGQIDLDTSLDELGMDDIQGLSAAERQATIRDIISARSGIYHPAANGGDNTADAPPRGSQPPGSYFLYNNWDFNAAGAIYEEATGRSVFEALDQELAQPLQFEDFDLSKHKKSGNLERSRYPAYHMHLSARDLARVGHLMLSQGRWRDSRILPPDWVEQMVTPHTQNAEMNPRSVRNTGLEYGYMWWLFDDDTSAPPYVGAYAGRGHYGQYLAVFPAIDLVIAHKTKAVRYQTPEEYAAVRVTWEKFMQIVSAVVSARL